MKVRIGDTVIITWVRTYEDENIYVGRKCKVLAFGNNELGNPTGFATDTCWFNFNNRDNTDIKYRLITREEKLRRIMK